MEMQASASIRMVIDALDQALPGKVLVRNTEDYQGSLASYFTTQEAELKPACIVKPTSAEDVAVVVKHVLLGNSDACLAVRSGGHNPSKGSANIAGGVTIDLRDLAMVSVNNSKDLVSVGAGAIWGHVYEKLEPLDLGVVGAHVYNVGVGGFILGGGLSSLSPRHGFACDMVENFEVVLASGEIVSANTTSNSDLWTALKGGSNNFGIVTRFDLRCFAQGKIWGGYTVSPMTSLEANLKAIADLDASWDEYASLKQSYTYSATTKYTIFSNFEYTKDSPEPEIFKPFLQIKPFYRNTLRIATLAELATELQGLQAAATRYATILGLWANANTAALLDKHSALPPSGSRSSIYTM